MKPRRKLAAARKKVGLTQEAFADALAESDLSPGVTREAVSRWERGLNGISIRHARAIAQFLDMPIRQAIELIEDDSSQDPAVDVQPTTRRWEINIKNLPWRPFIGYSGLSGLRSIHHSERQQSSERQ